MTAALQPIDKTILVNGLNIHYLDWGNAGKQPLILLHGISRVAHTLITSRRTEPSEVSTTL